MEKTELHPDDTMIQRAGKILRLIGFASDRIGVVPSIAAYLQIYHDFDMKRRTLLTEDDVRRVAREEMIRCHVLADRSDDV